MMSKGTLARGSFGTLKMAVRFRGTLTGVPEGAATGSSGALLTPQSERFQPCTWAPLCLARGWRKQCSDTPVAMGMPRTEMAG